MTRTAATSVGTPRTSGAPADGVRRTRGKNKAPAWRWDGPVSVIRLPLVVDAQAAVRLEGLFSAMFALKRALQHDARARVAAFWAGAHRRGVDGAGWRRELGLSRQGLERAAYEHLDASGWLRHHATKALALHQADEVWAGVERHLFPDASGRRAGRPRVGSWWEYTRIPGRARSHTTARKWETFRLHGSLQGHLDAYRHPALPGEVATPAQAARSEPGTAVLAQPRRMPPPAPPSGRSGRASWWEYEGPLAVVFTGGPDGSRGELVLPVRLPSGAGRWGWLCHFLDRPQLWHKIDLVRRPHPCGPGGWVYEAHLMILDGGYASPAARERRARAAGLERMGGVDVNVGNLSLVSFPTPPDPETGRVLADQIVLTTLERAAVERDRCTARRRARALERSRRAANKARYELSRRQDERARRRQDAGLAARHVDLPQGPRLADAAGWPRTAYRKDSLSGGYRALRTRGRAERIGRTEARRARARAVAARLVSTHGGRLTVEDCRLASWFRLWGRACAAFTPGMLTTALAAECAAVGGRLARAGTFTTRLSQHCLCGRRVPKPLSQRMHRCPACGLEADRDLVSAALGAFVTWTDATDPKTASVDFEASRHALGVYGSGLQGALAESTATGPSPVLPGGDGRGGSRTPGGAASARPHPERRRRRPRSETLKGPHRTDTAGHRNVSTARQTLEPDLAPHGLQQLLGLGPHLRIVGVDALVEDHRPQQLLPGGGGPVVRGPPPHDPHPAAVDGPGLQVEVPADHHGRGHPLLHHLGHRPGRHQAHLVVGVIALHVQPVPLPGGPQHLLPRHPGEPPAAVRHVQRVPGGRHHRPPARTRVREHLLTTLQPEQFTYGTRQARHAPQPTAR
ncbi:hypothetical protein GCM10009550_59020 [Actinocorallia libanotica]|uniref:Cas12f1-like TNB domain-containing protein n=1 Tax=Actinocorallia libanotica TaxID=46162 RepID=A0ABN1RTI6_9ACTN